MASPVCGPGPRATAKSPRSSLLSTPTASATAASVRSFSATASYVPASTTDPTLTSNPEPGWLLTRGLTTCTTAWAVNVRPWYSLNAMAARATTTVTAMISDNPLRQTRYSSRSDTVSSAGCCGLGGSLPAVVGRSTTLRPYETSGLEPLDPRL